VGTEQDRWKSLTTGRIVVLDVETTGLYPRRGDRIVALGMQYVDNGALTYPWYSLVNPERDVQATHIHGLTNTSVAAAPTFTQIAATVCEILSGVRAIAAHNASFDLRFLTAELERVEMALPTVPVLDTRALHRRLDVQAASEKLTDLAASYAVEAGPAHQADADAATAARLLLAQLWRGVAEQGWSVLEDLASDPQDVIASRASSSRGLAYVIKITPEDLERAQAKHLARENARDVTQAQIWQRYEQVSHTDQKQRSAALPALVDDALAAWPAGHQDLLDIVEFWQCEASSALKRARSQLARRKAAASCAAACELEYAQMQAAGVCSSKVSTYWWTEALALLPTEDAVAAVKRWYPQLQSWLACGLCTGCQYGGVLKLYYLARAVVPATIDGPQQALDADATVRLWLAEFASLGDQKSVDELTRAWVNALERAGLMSEAITAAEEGIARGCRSFEVANRLGLILERKIKDTARALTVSLETLAWPVPSSMNSKESSSLDAVGKRAARLSR
jgi:DNA polymerase III epsilon subunit-like protein